jgi:hypothetical protein
VLLTSLLQLALENRVGLAVARLTGRVSQSEH